MLKLEFTGFVEELKQFDWGVIAKMTHNRRQLNDAGAWETVGKDYLDVKLKPEHLPFAVVGKQLKVTGVLKPGIYQKKDGTSGIQLSVTALDVEYVLSGSDKAMSSIGATPITDAPF